RDRIRRARSWSDGAPFTRQPRRQVDDQRVGPRAVLAFYGVTALRTVLPRLKSKGFTFVTCGAHASRAASVEPVARRGAEHRRPGGVKPVREFAQGPPWWAWRTGRGRVVSGRAVRARAALRSVRPARPSLPAVTGAARCPRQIPTAIPTTP